MKIWQQMLNFTIKYKSGRQVLETDKFKTKGSVWFFETPQNELIKFDAFGRSADELKNWKIKRLELATNSKVEILA